MSIDLRSVDWCVPLEVPVALLPGIWRLAVKYLATCREATASRREQAAEFPALFDLYKRDEAAAERTVEGLAFLLRQESIRIGCKRSGIKAPSLKALERKR